MKDEICEKATPATVSLQALDRCMRYALLSSTFCQRDLQDPKKIFDLCHILIDYPSLIIILLWMCQFIFWLIITIVYIYIIIYIYMYIICVYYTVPPLYPITSHIIPYYRATPYGSIVVY